MAERSILEELVPGYPAEQPTERDRERAVTAGVKIYIEADSQRSLINGVIAKLGSVSVQDQTIAREKYAIGMEQVGQIADELDKTFSDWDRIPWRDIIESISLTDTDPRTGVPFQPVD